MVYVIAVHMEEGGSGHEHIAEVKWRNPQSGDTGKATCAAMVDWIKNKAGDARVSDGKVEARVAVVDATPPYLRTHADGKWTNNLLALPRY